MSPPALDCSITFFPSYCVLQDLWIGKQISDEHELWDLYYLNVELATTITYRATHDSDIYLWHCKLGHHVLSSLSYIVSIPFTFPSLPNDAYEFG